MIWFSASVLAAVLAGGLGAPLQAQNFPSRPITIVVTSAAGGVTDVVARAVGQRLAEAWRQQVIIENKGGAAHSIGAAAVAKAAPDGHTLMACESGTMVLIRASTPKASCLTIRKRISLRLPV